MSRDRAFEVRVMAVDHAADLKGGFTESGKRGGRFCLDMFGWDLVLGGAIVDVSSVVDIVNGGFWVLKPGSVLYPKRRYL